MQNDEVIQATLLLSCFFNKSEVKTVKPLTPVEYGRFATWLHHQGYNPASLLHDQAAVLANWQDPKGTITAERIQHLLDRGASMGFALEHWAKHGVWVVSRGSQLYPMGVKRKIGVARPPIFFGVGNQDLLNKQGIGFVGSRSIDDADQAFTQAKAARAIEQGYVVVSGGAKGVDQTAMLTALSSGGESVGILSDSLLRSSTSKAYREGLKHNRLALISPFYPEAGFSTGNAMARNKYIYAMSNAVVVVKSDFNKGGTWTGAKENLKKQWAPVLVRHTDYDGNRELIKLGAMAIDDSFDDFTAMPVSTPVATEEAQQQPMDDLFSAPVSEPETSVIADKQSPVGRQEPLNIDTANAIGTVAQGSEHLTQSEIDKDKQINADNTAVEQSTETENKADIVASEATSEKSILDHNGPILRLFYQGLLDEYRGQREITPQTLAEKYPELSKAQLNTWLKLLLDEGYLARPNRKLIYRLTAKASQ